MSDIRIRFFLKLGSGSKYRPLTTKRALAQSATTIVQNVALAYADGYRDQLFGAVASRIERDVMGEISNAAMVYKRLVTRASQRNALNAARIEGAAVGAPSASLGGLGWQPLTPRYRRLKQHELGHTNFFRAWTHYLASELGRGRTWTKLFGPVKVDVALGKSRGAAERRQSDFGGQAFARPAKENQDRQTVRIHIGSVSVTALEKIRVEDLRSMTRDGVPRIVGDTDLELAYRLAPGPAPYRPSLEPFLSFVLSRSIPFAVQKRVEQGLRGSIR